MILALETSTRRASLAVYDRGSGALVAEADFTTERAHNAAIFTPLEKLIAEYRTELEGIVVGLGPGSYGGVRVGLAVANGLSVAMGLPVAGASSLEAWDSPSDSYLVVGDARRGTFFVALVRDRILQGEPDLIAEAEVAGFLENPLAEGLALHTSDPKVATAFPLAILSFPVAGRLAARFRETDFSAMPRTALEPHYLRAPYITLPKAK